MTVKDVIDFLNDYAPLEYAEDFDNAGLIVGDKNNKVSGILICHDSIPEVIDEAINLGYNLIISFHPILFKGIKKLTPNNYVNRSIIKAVKNDISIFSTHTALDNSKFGVNMQLCKKIGISETKILFPKKDTIKKLTTFIPSESAHKLKDEIFKVKLCFVASSILVGSNFAYMKMSVLIPASRNSIPSSIVNTAKYLTPSPSRALDIFIAP